MVDFNNESTIGTPALDIVKVLILQRRHDTMEAWEHYNKMKGSTDADTSIFQARLFTLFSEVQAMLKRRKKEEDYNKLYKACQSQDEKELEGAFWEINEELDRLNLTKIDTRRVYDTTRVENENKEKGI